ncbi:ribose-phosphate diphosphokinase [Candidatus Bathyarchaeota archaeon]|nr:ribose-phosphate diphosphokinase [Candidatus Bathyarchaeota archaeon]
MIVVPGPSSQSLGKRIAEELKAKTVEVTLKEFPDGEYSLRFKDEVVDEDIVVVQTTGPPQDTNIMQLILMLDAAKDLGAKKVTAVVPYLAFARQDKRFLTGEVVSAKTIVKLIENSGIERFITVNIHAKKTLKNFKVPNMNLSAITLLADHFKHRGLYGAFSLSPDKGAIGLAEEADKILEGGHGWLRKERDRYTGEIQVEEKNLNVKGLDVIVFDDIISTGGTIARAIKMLKNQGARRVFAACVHPLLIGDAKNKILNSGAEEIVGTDSIASSIKSVSLAPMISEALSR